MKILARAVGAAAFAGGVVTVLAMAGVAAGLTVQGPGADGGQRCGACAQTPSRDGMKDLGGTSWRLVKFMGGDDTILTPDDRSKYTISFEADGHVSARIDCNRGRGTWESSGPNQLRFGLLATTRAMCPPGSLFDRVVRDWPYVRSYIIKDGHLYLSLMADAGIYEYEPANAEGAAAGHVKGTASYRERMALPPNAIFEATLEDVSKADAPAEVIGRFRKENPGNPPFPFEITYDISRIDPSHRYAVRGRILVGGKLLFTTDQVYPVLTAWQGNEVALMLRSVPGPASGNSEASLEKTYWKLIRFGDTPVTAASEQQEAHLIFDPGIRRVSGSGGCNRLTGSFELNDNQLTFGPMATTMMACPESMDTEKKFLEALREVKTWKIEGQQLELSGAAGNVVARLEAHPLPTPARLP